MDKSNFKVYYLGGEEIQVSEEEIKKCNFYSIKTVKEKGKNINHHILLLDVSFSMVNEIEGLKESVKKTLEALKEEKNNYVSAIIYSGHDEAIRILNGVKCDDISYKMADVYGIIDKELYARGVTVISEPLEMAIDIVKNLSNICNKHHIALFTDGFLVTDKWEMEEEKEKILNLARICSEKGIFFNGLGFGKYYDRKFLKKIVEEVGTGSFNHIEKIKDYYKSILELTSEINRRNIFDLDIKNKEYFILDTYSKGKEGKIRTIVDGEETIICTFDEEIDIGNNILNNKKMREKLSSVKEDFLYSLAINHIINEDIESAQIAIAQTGDVEAYESLDNCYSFLEKGRAISNLKFYLKNREERFKKGKKDIKVNTLREERICLLEILEDIMLDDESRLLWDYSYRYKRIGRKTKLVEDKYEFIKPKVGYGKVVDVLIGRKKLNVGVRVKVDGQILDKETNLKIDGHVFRHFNLILNGNINTEFIPCVLSDELKEKFMKEKIVSGINKYGREEIITLDLRKLKTTNKRIFKSLDMKTISEYLYKIEQLKCKVWAINKILENLTKDKEEELTLTEQIRENYRIDETGLYKPLGTEFADEKFEVYEAKVLEWKIEKFPKKKECDDALDFYSNFKSLKDEEKIEELKKELYKVKKEKEKLNYKVNLVRLSCGLISKSAFVWENEEEKSKTETDREIGANAVVDNKVIISKRKINNINMRQDRYNILTKCD